MGEVGGVCAPGWRCGRFVVALSRCSRLGNSVGIDVGTRCGGAGGGIVMGIGGGTGLGPAIVEDAGWEQDDGRHTPVRVCLQGHRMPCR